MNPTVPPKLILIMGLPCTGKSTMARQLAQELQLPLIAKDEIKEMLFDGMGFQDRDWSKKLGGMSYDLLYWSIDKVLRSGSSVLVDVDFSDPSHASERLRTLKETVPFQFLRINLISDGKVLYQRFQQRSLSGERHPGHVDHDNFDEFKPILLRGRRKLLDVEGELLTVDTTIFESVEFELVSLWIRDRLSN